MMRLVLLAPLFASSLVSAAAIPGAELPPSVQKYEGYGHYATFTEPDDGFSFTLHGTNYFGPPLEITINSSSPEFNISPERPVFRHTPMTQDVGFPVLEDRNFCRKIGTCLKTWSQTAAAGAVAVANTSKDRCKKISASVVQYFTENNYNNLKSVLVGVPVGIVINIASTPITNALFNSKHEVVKGDGGDSCDLYNKAVLANDFAAAVGEFCVAIHNAKVDSKVDTHYIAGDVANGKPGKARGSASVTKAFVAAQAGIFGPTCEAMGITW